MVLYGSRFRSQHGFTLVELVIVLFILAGLAGVMVPLFSNTFVQRTHGATSAANIEELTKAISRMPAEFGLSPDGWELLVVDPAGAPAIYAPIPNSAAELTLVTTLPGEQITALVNAGITQVISMNPADPATINATFESTVGGTTLDLTTATSVPAVTALGTAIQRELGADPAQTYVVFGLGQISTMVGKVMASAPVHTLDAGNPATTYARMLAVYRVTGPGTTGGGGAARFVGFIAADGEQLAGLNTHLSEYHAANANP